MALEEKYTSLFKEIVHHILFPVFPWPPGSSVPAVKVEHRDRGHGCSCLSRPSPPSTRLQCILVCLGQAQVNYPETVLCLSL